MNTIDISCIDIEHEMDMEKMCGFCEKVLDHEDIDNWELSILLCNDGFIHSLNVRYRNIDAPTDVLSFRQDTKSFMDVPFTAGDIVISLDTLKKNCENYGEEAENEMKRLFIHGILHLTGMDHNETAEGQPMLKVQEEIMEQFVGEKLF